MPRFLMLLSQRWQQWQHRRELGRRQSAQTRADRKRARRLAAVVKAADSQKAARQRAQAFQRRRTAERRPSRGLAFSGVCAALAVSLLVNLMLAAKWSPNRALLTVGRHTITKREYDASLDAAAGRPVLTRMVAAELITQAAAQAGVTPTPAEIDARVALLRRSGALPGLPPADLRVSVGRDIALENLRMQGISVSEAEIAAEYARSPARYRLPAQIEATLVIASGPAKTAQAVHLLGTGASPAEIAATEGLQVDGVNGFALPGGALSPGLRAAILAQKDGAIKVYSSRGGGPDAALVVRANSHTAAALPPLSAVHDLVARTLRLQKAPSASAELVTLYAANKPVFDMTNYQPYLSELEAAAAKAAAPKTASVP